MKRLFIYWQKRGKRRKREGKGERDRGSFKSEQEYEGDRVLLICEGSFGREVHFSLLFCLIEFGSLSFKGILNEMPFNIGYTVPDFTGHCMKPSWVKPTSPKQQRFPLLSLPPSSACVVWPVLQSGHRSINRTIISHGYLWLKLSFDRWDCCLEYPRRCKDQMILIQSSGINWNVASLSDCPRSIPQVEYWVPAWVSL